jgi:hypothetical protein
VAAKEATDENSKIDRKHAGNKRVQHEKGKEITETNVE